MTEQRDSGCNKTPLYNGNSGIIMMAIVAVAYGVLNFLTPLYHDDFVYKFMFEGGAVNYDHPIRSIGDIIASQVDHYTSVNGRSIVHFLVQLFTGLLGKTVFNLFNVIVFCAFIFLPKRQSIGGKRLEGDARFCVSTLRMSRPATTSARGRDARFCVSTLVILVLVLLMPRFKDTFLWMTGSINYLWSATAALGFLLIYEKRRDRAMDWALLPMLLVAFLLGWTHEGITLPLAASLVLINLFSIKKNRGRVQGLWLALAYLAGGCVIALAPGTIARSGMGGGLTPSILGLKVITGFVVLAKLRIIYLALLATVIAWFTRRDTAKQVIKHNSYLILAMFLSLGIVFTSGLESSRTAFGLELFAMIYLLRLLAEWWGDYCRDAKSCVSKGRQSISCVTEAEVKRPRQGEALRCWCNIGLTIGLAIFYALLLRHTIASWQESQRLISQIERTTDGIIGTREHDAGIFSSHICTMLSLDSTVNAMNYDPHGWPASIAATYHRDSLVFLPQAFLDDLKAQPRRYDSLSLDMPYEFYVQRIHDDAVIKQVDFLLESNDFSEIPIVFRPIARRMNRYTDTTVTTSKWVTLSLYGRRYLLIKRDHQLAHRLKAIRILDNNPLEKQSANKTN